MEMESSNVMSKTCCIAEHWKRRRRLLSDNGSVDAWQRFVSLLIKDYDSVDFNCNSGFTETYGYY